MKREYLWAKNLEQFIILNFLGNNNNNINNINNNNINNNNNCDKQFLRNAFQDKN